MRYMMKQPFIDDDSTTCAQVKGTLPLTLMKDGRGMVQQCLDSLIDRQTVLEVYLSRRPMRDT